MRGNPGTRRVFMVGLMAAAIALSFAGGAFATHVFSDVPTSAYYHDDVSWLVAQGITAGCGGNKYCPHDPVTREQMAVFLHKMANRPRVGHFSCDARAFQPVNSTQSFTIGSGGAQSDAPLVCPVDLPDGATVTKLSVTLYDNHATNVSCTLFRQDILTATGTYTEMVNVASALTPGGVRLTDASVQFADVDGNRYSYAIYCTYGAQSSDLVVFGATITYTYPGVPLP